MESSRHGFVCSWRRKCFCPETCIIPHTVKSYQDQSEYFEPAQNPLPKYCYSWQCAVRRVWRVEAGSQGSAALGMRGDSKCRLPITGCLDFSFGLRQYDHTKLFSNSLVMSDKHRHKNNTSAICYVRCNVIQNYILSLFWVWILVKLK